MGVYILSSKKPVCIYSWLHFESFYCSFFHIEHRAHNIHSPHDNRFVGTGKASFFHVPFELICLVSHWRNKVGIYNLLFKRSLDPILCGLSGVVMKGSLLSFEEKGFLFMSNIFKPSIIYYSQFLCLLRLLSC